MSEEEKRELCERIEALIEWMGDDVSLNKYRERLEVAHSYITVAIDAAEEDLGRR